MYKKNAWEKYNNEDLNKLFKFGDDYIDFISNYKTEREITNISIKLLEENGFKALNKVDKVNPGDKIYQINRGKNVCAFIIGKDDILDGINVLGAHIDSPRLDIKQNPLYEDNELAYLDTHYYGGIIKYQWVARTLAIHGVVCLKDGTTLNVNIGDNLGDPVFCITDLLPHLGKDKLDKKANNVIEGEDLDLLIGHQKIKDIKVKDNILKILENKYNFSEEDFISSELEIVPEGKARSLGLDNSMVLGYGHDDRVCAYSSLRALLDTKSVKKTACCILVDKEEIGSVGATGAHSKFFENTIAELIYKIKGNYNDLYLKKTLTNSYVLSSDVSAGYDPLYKNVYEKNNTCYLGYGLTFNKYTGARGKSGCNDASAEYLAKLRKILDDNNINYQTSELGKVDQGGGGTIAYILANLDMNVIDAGVPVLSMHAPSEVISKADLYEAYLGYIAFIKNM